MRIIVSEVRILSNIAQAKTRYDTFHAYVLRNQTFASKNPKYMPASISNDHIRLEDSIQVNSNEN